MAPRVCQLALLFVTVAAHFDAPNFTVDLDRPPSERWGDILEDLLDQHGWDHSFGPVIDFMTSVLPLEDWKKYDLLFQGVGFSLLGLEWMEEIRGIYAAAKKRNLGDKVTTGMLVFFQLFYELLMECTGLVAQHPSGAVTHARNLDIGLPVQNITAQITWVRKGVAELVTTQFVGYIGVHTGMRMNGWSVQANERVVLELGPWGYSKSIIASDILALLEKHKPVGYTLRETLLSTTTFDDAVQKLSDVKLVAPLYFIMSGAKPGEGAVITKNRDGLAHAPAPHENVMLLNQSSTFYLAQTNWDNWIPINKQQCEGTEAALPTWVQQACTKVLKALYGNTGGCMDLCQLTSDGRYERAVELLNQMGKERVSADNMFNILSDDHVEQSITAFTALINPATNSYRTVVRDHRTATHDVENKVFKHTREAGSQLLKWLLKRAEVLVPGSIVV